jgi:hypothetical protein
VRSSFRLSPVVLQTFTTEQFLQGATKGLRHKPPKREQRKTPSFISPPHANASLNIIPGYRDSGYRNNRHLYHPVQFIIQVSHHVSPHTHELSPRHTSRVAIARRNYRHTRNSLPSYPKQTQCSSTRWPPGQTADGAEVISVPWILGRLQ